MVFNEVISSWAEDDLSNILHQAPSSQAAARFLADFYTMVELLTKHPYAFRIRYKETRVVTFKKLPFKLVYQVIEPNTLYIIAVLHEKMSDDNWMERS